jgi:4-amino-4-deoxy-L-arabinose transferase-like glycosyltransferase
MTPSGPGGWRVAAVALALGLAALWVIGPVVRPGLSWNDELVYAAAGRHVADGQGPLSSFYHPDAIAARGFPQPDVHMPGHAYLLGAAFRIAGPSESAAIATSRIGFLGALVLLAWAVARRWGEAAGLVAALLFVLFPPDVAFAHTAMSESGLTLLSTAFLALFLGASERPSVARAIGFALVLGAGTIHHETFLVYGPAAIWAITRWPRPERTRGLLAFAGVLGVCLALALPLYLARAPHPHVLSDVLLSDETAAERVGTMTQNLLANLRGLPLWPAAAWQWNHALQWVALIAAGVLGWRAGGERLEVAAVSGLAFLGTWGLVALVYPVGDWRAVRLFMHAMPAALAVIAAALASPASRRRWALGLRALVPAGIAAVAVSSLIAVGRDRAYHDEFGRAYSEFLARSTAGREVRVIVATKAYRYGWDAYPVAVVVWEATDLKRVRQVEQALPVDAIVVRREERRRFLRGLEDGAYRRAFRPAPTEPFHDRYQVWLADGARPAVSSTGSSGR